MKKTLVILILIVCPFLAQAEIDENDIVGVELILTGHCKFSYQCIFGHSSLRLVSGSGLPQDDYVIGYATPKGPQSGFLKTTAYSIKSVVKLPLMTRLRRLGHDVNKSIVRDDRKVYRLPLQLTLETKNELIKIVNDSFFNESDIVNDKSYSLLRDNCSGYLMELLSDAGAPMMRYSVAAPRFMAKHFYKSYIALYPSIEVSSVDDMAVQLERLPGEYYTYCVTARCAQTISQYFDEIWGDAAFKPLTSPYDLIQARDKQGKVISGFDSFWKNKKNIISGHLDLIEDVFAFN